MTRVGFLGTLLASPSSELSSCFFPQVLSTLGLGSDMQVELWTLQLPVDYRKVTQRVTESGRIFNHKQMMAGELEGVGLMMWGSL